MTSKDQRLIWESFSQSQQASFFYPQVDGSVVELNLSPKGSIIDQSPDGELVVIGTKLSGYSVKFPTGLNPQRKLSYMERQQPQVRSDIAKHLETTLEKSLRDPKFAAQDEMRIADYNRGSNRKGD